jgi:hypothetical protein
MVDFFPLLQYVKTIDFIAFIYKIFDLGNF